MMDVAASQDGNVFRVHTTYWWLCVVNLGDTIGLNPIGETDCAVVAMA